jgi:putative ABC transport system ATP-binding protein
VAVRAGSVAVRAGSAAGPRLLVLCRVALFPRAVEMTFDILTWGDNRGAGDPTGELPTTVELDAVFPHSDYPDGPTPVIELHDVTKVYSTGSLDVHALQGVSLRIDQGEYVAIMGPSGSGKSTLMHIIGCLDVPTEGIYLLAGEDVGEMDEVDLAQVRNRQIGFVFQQFNLLPSLNAWRNVELPLTYAGVKRDERKRRALEALDRVGLADRVGHRPGELSGGQQQRVAVARALVSDPALILADEPTGNLDSVATEDALTLFDELHAQGRTIVLITHEIDVAQRSRRIVRVRDGRIQSDGPGPR